jgi:chitin synthase
MNQFNRLVTYMSEDFPEHNLDVVSPDFVLLLRGASAHDAAGGDPSGSNNLFINGLLLSVPE